MAQINTSFTSWTLLAISTAPPFPNLPHFHGPPFRFLLKPTRSVPSRLPTLVSATEERLEEDTKAEVAECSLRGLNCHQIAAKLQIAPRAVWKACYEMVVDGILPDMPQTPPQRVLLSEKERKLGF